MNPTDEKFLSTSTQCNERDEKPTRAVVITGALGGIGQALCSEFRQAGYFVIGTDLQEGKAECDVFRQLDVRELVQNSEIREQFVQEVEATLAERSLRLAGLINNAAIQLLNPTEKIALDQWNVTLETNLLAPFFLTQALLGLLEDARGAVVNIGSVHAVATKPEFVCYATSKSALVGLTRSMAVDLGPRVRVNAINPGATATPMLLAGFENHPERLAELDRMHPLNRIGKPEEVAQAALFLCSEQAQFIAGSCLHVDGGVGVRLHDPT